MTTNKKQLWGILLASVLAMGASSCSKDDALHQTPTRNREEKITPLGEVVKLDIAGEYIAGNYTEARYISNASEEGIKITLSAQEIANPKKLRLQLVQKEKPNQVTTVYVTPKITEVSAGKYRINYTGEIQLVGAGQSFTTGTWYIGAIYGAENNNTTFSIHNRNPYIFLANGESVNTNLPLVVRWTRLYTRQAPAIASETATQATGSIMSQLSPDLGRNFALSYKPDGVLLRVRSINGLLSPMPIAQVVIETDEFSTGAAKYPAVSSVTVEQLERGATPSQLTANTTPRDPIRINADIPMDIRFVASGEAISKDAYIWLHETNRTYQANTKTRVWVNANGPETGSAEWKGVWEIENRLLGKRADGSLDLVPYSNYDKANQFGRKGSTTRYATRYRLYGGERSYLVPKRSADKPYKPGHIYPVNTEVTSDLVITELYVDRPTSSNPVQTSALIEIYNPSLREIDLSKYGLVRIYTKNEVSEKYVCPGIPTDGSGKPGDFMDQALVLPLNPSLDYGKWNPNALGVKPDGDKWSTNGAYIHNARPNYDGYTITFKDYASTFGCEALSAESTLGPGKTMIILSSRYLLDGYSPNITRDAYVTVGNERVADVFKQVKSAVDQGYCQYVFAANNPKNVSAAPNSTESGVMSVGFMDYFSIVKIKSDGKRTFVDSDWLYKWGEMAQDKKIYDSSATKGYVRKRRLPVLGNNSILFTQDHFNRTAYTVGGSTNFSTFGVLENREYEANYTYDRNIQPLVDRRDAAKIQPK